MSCVETSDALDALLRSQPALWRGRDQYNDNTAIPTGFSALDQALPSRGWSMGCVTELLVDQHGIGEFSLLLPALQHITADDQWAALVNPPYLPYAPALSNAGVRLDRLLIINTQNDTDTLWACEQILRAGLFVAVIAWVDRGTPQQQRRLQIAAEAGKSWATVYRPAAAQHQHSPAAMRIVVSQSAPSSRLSLELIKSRGTSQRTVVIHPIEFDQPQGVEWPGLETDARQTESVLIHSLGQ